MSYTAPKHPLRWVLSACALAIALAVYLSGGQPVSQPLAAQTAAGRQRCAPGSAPQVGPVSAAAGHGRSAALPPAGH